MSLLTTTITNWLNQVARSAQLATLLPASILVVLNSLFILPLFGIKIEDAVLQGSLLVVTIVTISYILWLCNGPLIQMLEGYPWSHTGFGEKHRQRQKKNLADLESNIRICEQQLELINRWMSHELPRRYIGRGELLPLDPDYLQFQSLREHWRFWLAYYQKLRWDYYPRVSDRILPTRMGNTIAAFEEYPEMRYGISANILWPRMVPILDSNGFASYVERDKAAFDFILNLGAVAFVLVFECLALLCRFLDPIWIFWAVMALTSLIPVYYLLVENAIYWGDMTKVAFDLYRDDLRVSLGVRSPVSLNDERGLWRSVSEFIARGTEPRVGTFLFDPETDDNQQT